MSHTYTECLHRAQRIAQENGFKLNSDGERVQKVVGLMADNYDAVGEWICPCKQQHKPPVKSADKVCPCPEWIEEIRRDGSCFCKLFFAEERA
jgi:ferredoxin-thioredoxin reductase catalytic subunit